MSTPRHPRRKFLASLGALPFIGRLLPAHESTDPTCPLELIHRYERDELPWPGDDVVFDMLHDIAIEATRVHPLSREAWNHRAHYGWMRGMMDSESKEALFEDVLFSAKQLERLGAYELAESARLDVYEEARAQQFFAAMDRRHGLSEKMANLQFFDYGGRRISKKGVS